MSEPSNLPFSDKVKLFEVKEEHSLKKRRLSESKNSKLRVKFLSTRAKAPKRISVNIHGYYLYSASDITIPPKGEALVSIDIEIGLPEGTHGCVVSRKNGLAIKSFDVVEAEPVEVMLFNNREVDFQVKEGDRIAKLVIERYYTPDVIEVEDLKVNS